MPNVAHHQARVTVRIPETEVAWLDGYAAATGQSRSSILRFALTRFLQTQEVHHA